MFDQLYKAQRAPERHFKAPLLDERILLDWASVFVRLKKIMATAIRVFIRSQLIRWPPATKYEF